MVSLPFFVRLTNEYSQFVLLLQPDDTRSSLNNTRLLTGILRHDILFIPSSPLVVDLLPPTAAVFRLDNKTIPTVISSTTAYLLTLILAHHIWLNLKIVRSKTKRTAGQTSTVPGHIYLPRAYSLLMARLAIEGANSVPRFVELTH